MEGITLHKKLSTICIYAYYMMQKTNDLRYLIKNVDYDELPEIEITNEFNEAQIELLKDFEKMDLQLQNLYIDAIQSVIKYMDDKNKTNEQQCNETFHKYLKFISKNFKNVEYGNKVYSSIPELYNYLKENLDWNKLIIRRVIILDFNKMNSGTTKEWNLYEEIGQLKMILGFDIDEFKTSMKKYLSFRDLAKKKIETQQIKKETKKWQK